MVAAIGALLVKFKSLGFAKVIGQTGTFQSKFGKMSKTVQPAVEKLSASFKKFGLITSGVLFSLIAASPRLSAEFEILSIRIQQFLRPFGDELAPVIRIVSGLVNSLREAFETLPEPIQEAITFGAGFVVTLGLLAGAASTITLLLSPISLVLIGIGLAAAALKLAWDENFGGIQDTVQTVFDRIAPIFESIGNLMESIGGALGTLGDDFSFVFKFIEDYIGGVVENITDIINNILDAIKGFIDGIAALLSGDIEGAIAGFQEGFKNMFEAIVGLALLWLDNLIALFLSFVTNFFDAGTDLGQAFLDGLVAILEGAGDIISNALDFVGGFLGGSLPERGPLMNIQHWGEELGQNYVLAISSGVESRPGNISRSLNIQNLNLGFKEEQLETERTFFDGVSEGVRKSTSF